MNCYNLKIDSLTCLKNCGRYSQSMGWNHDGKSLKNNMLVLLESGDCSFNTSEGEYVLEPGDLFFIPRGTWYRPNTKNGCTYLYFHFVASEANDEEIRQARLQGERRFHFGDVISIDYHLLTLPRKTASDYQIRQSLGLAIADIQGEDPEKLARMNMSFFVALVRLSELTRQTEQTLAYRIKKYVAEHMIEELSLGDIASHFGYTKQHVARVLVAGFGVTPSKLMDRLRLERAAGILCEGEKSIGEVAAMCGFNDANYFSRRFKKQFAISPTEYRDRMRKSIL